MKNGEISENKMKINKLENKIKNLQIDLENKNGIISEKEYEIEDLSNEISEIK